MDRVELEGQYLPEEVLWITLDSQVTSTQTKLGLSPSSAFMTSMTQCAICSSLSYVTCWAWGMCSGHRLEQVWTVKDLQLGLGA